MDRMVSSEQIVWGSNKAVTEGIGFTMTGMIRADPEHPFDAAVTE